MTQRPSHGVVQRLVSGLVGSGPVLRSRIVLVQLAAGATCLLLGTLPVLAGVGLVETEGGIEPIGRIVAVLFGGVFGMIGGVLVGTPLLARAHAHGAVTWREAVRLGLAHLWRRPTAASAIAALWMAPLAAGYGITAAGVTLPRLGDAGALSAVLVVEFLVIHGFPFLVIATAFMKAGQGAGRFVAGGALGLLTALYGVFAWVAAGKLAGVLALLYLMSPNVLAFARAEPSGSARVLVTSRWVIKFALFMLTAMVVGSEGSFEGPGAVRVGAVYFTLLAVVELFRVVEIPMELLSGADAAAD